MEQKIRQLSHFLPGCIMANVVTHGLFKIQKLIWEWTALLEKNTEPQASSLRHYTLKKKT